ncbi:hypothetical protein L2449_30730 [Mesorhizobium muleiense]|uniref:hypothetical protein n=1 Tax=Mesorhizobium muleiense TaxID=1004279 RepID=UPI001F15EE18|nr:hypothetical protein [Mesorhizobium muleiense]MCF6121199.1 hypothetical protein [Mesorhizobium muleiense]
MRVFDAKSNDSILAISIPIHKQPADQISYKALCNIHFGVTLLTATLMFYRHHAYAAGRRRRMRSFVQYKA